MSLLAGLLLYGIARYLMMPHVARGVSELMGDCIIFEDASRGQRRVPISHCEHFAMFKAFLEMHYQGQPGETFIKAGQFNLMLGSRRGLALLSSD